MSLQHAYETKILKSTNTSKILMDYSKSQLGGSKRPEVIPHVFFVTESDEVEPFPYPIYNKTSGYVLVDSRPFTSLDQQNNIKVRNELDDALFKKLAQLEYIWATANRYDAIQNAFRYSSEVFVRWLTETIKHKYGLGADADLKLKALTGMYVLGQFYNNITDEQTVVRYLGMIAQEQNVPMHFVQSVSESIGNEFPRDIDEFVAAINKVELGPRMRGFNSKELYALVSSAWWANTNTPYIVGAALEYPPAFAALVYMAVENKFYKRTGIGARVDAMNGRNAHDDFKRAIMLLVEQYSIS